MPVTNQFFDENDMSDNPIKTTLSMLAFGPTKGISQAFVYNIGINRAILRDNSVSGYLGQQNLTFYTTRFERS